MQKLLVELKNTPGGLLLKRIHTISLKDTIFFVSEKVYYA
ncbi:hypothetical protein BMS3Bbin15_00551 [archaeon BMS3Bbin15]|nr:hypothetical protein BMS3Bbin15_00551 [archaeon BMS3Bbin15]